MKRSKLSKSQWTKEEIKEARVDVAMLYDPSPLNLCYSDGYYALSLEELYGMSITDLMKITGVPQFKTKIKWRRV